VLPVFVSGAYVPAWLAGALERGRGVKVTSAFANRLWKKAQ
jgi:hypothetical protein